MHSNMRELACLRWQRLAEPDAVRPTPTRDCGFFGALSDMRWNVASIFSVVVDVRLAIL